MPGHSRLISFIYRIHSVTLIQRWKGFKVTGSHEGNLRFESGTLTFTEDGKFEVQLKRGIEVGHIFQLGDNALRHFGAHPWRTRDHGFIFGGNSLR